jgi:DNA-directed RNA polymerase specialized sigma24 family protein
VTTLLVDSDVLAEAMRAYQSGDASAFDRLYAGLGPDEAAIARDRLRRGLATLTPGTRRVVLMHHVQGWSFREIAARLGIKSAAARLRSSRGVNALRTRLEDRRDGDEHE